MPNSGPELAGSVYGKAGTHQDFAHNTVVLCLNIDGGFVRLLHIVGRGELNRPLRRILLTISSRTSPAANDSPSFFFHDATPPSVIVGDIAGIWNFVVACRTAVVCSPAAHTAVSDIWRYVLGQRTHIFVRTLNATSYSPPFVLRTSSGAASRSRDK